jgi:hypothetical protein
MAWIRKWRGSGGNEAWAAAKLVKMSGAKADDSQTDCLHVFISVPQPWKLGLRFIEVFMIRFCSCAPSRNMTGAISIT